MDLFINEILLKVSQHTGIPAQEIRSATRKKEVCTARSIFMHVVRKNLGTSCRYIGHFLNRSGQNVSILLLNFEQELRICRMLKKKVQDIEKELFI